MRPKNKLQLGKGRTMRTIVMKGIAVSMTLALVFAATASASPGKDMAAAMRALRYPKAGAIKIGCRAAGNQFRCKSTYRHHRHRVFYAGWAANGGWICAGPKSVGCKMLKHGFVPNDQVATNGSVQFSAELAAQGYMAFKYGQTVTYPATPCAQSGKPSTWSFCYRLTDTSNVNVTIHMGRVKAGYVTTASATTY